MFWAKKEKKENVVKYYEAEWCCWLFGPSSVVSSSKKDQRTILLVSCVPLSWSDTDLFVRTISSKSVCGALPLFLVAETFPVNKMCVPLFFLFYTFSISVLISSKRLSHTRLQLHFMLKCFHLKALPFQKRTSLFYTANIFLN